MEGDIRGKAGWRGKGGGGRGRRREGGRGVVGDVGAWRGRCVCVWGGGVEREVEGVVDEEVGAWRGR